MPLTPSEQLVFDLCKRSFLSLWSYANPRKPSVKQPKGKELCDVLAVFGRDVILFSVKDVTFKPHADPNVAASRWTRGAVDESIDQLRGARRILAKMEHVRKEDGSEGVRLPPLGDRRVHLVAVAAGGNREVPFAGGVRDGGYVHVIDEIALREVLKELDTAPDFLAYLEAKESFNGTVVCEGEENVFATYLHNGRRFPDVNLLMAHDGLWAEVQEKPEFKARKVEDAISYWWDDRIERLIADCVVPSEASSALNENEGLVRAMASESRFDRRILSGTFVEWLMQRKAGARTLFSPRTETGYVLLTCARERDRNLRVAELGARCLHARSPAGPLWRTGSQPTRIVGLATEIYDPAGWSMDAMYIEKRDWSADDERAIEQGRELFEIGEDSTFSKISHDEFPSVSQPPRRTKLGRNDPCPCGSGTKWKKCHGM
jgi:hypothetical protein